MGSGKTHTTITPADSPHRFVLSCSVAAITHGMIYQHASALAMQASGLQVFCSHAELNQVSFEVKSAAADWHVRIFQDLQETSIFCDCDEPAGKLCSHQTAVLLRLQRESDWILFFDHTKRQEKLHKTAFDYGLENETNLDAYFQLSYEYNRLTISPTQPALTPVTGSHLRQLLQTVSPASEPLAKAENTEKPLVIWTAHRYYGMLLPGLYTAATGKNGLLKNPITPIDLQQHIWQQQDGQLLRFYLAVQRLQARADEKLTALDLEALRTLAGNAPNHTFYLQDGPAPSAKTLKPVELKRLPVPVSLRVAQHAQTYELSAGFMLNGIAYDISELTFQDHCFVEISQCWYLLDQLPVINLLTVLRQHGGKMLVAASAFAEFRTQFLDQIADHILIDYTFIARATDRQLALTDYLTDMEKLIYLSDHGTHVMLIPVMRYSDVEISVRMNRQIYGRDKNGQEFLVERDITAESELLALLVKQHPDFSEQLENPLDHFYLHKRHFLNEDWFLPVFEDWGRHGIRVFGFNELEGNNINPHRIKVDIKVHSGINWFNADLDIRFGGKKAPIKKVQVAVKNKSKYIQLDDGTLGLLPQEWLEKFEAYFNAGELDELEQLRIARINFSDVQALFDPDMLDEQAQTDIRLFKEKARQFASVSEVAIPEGLTGTLRGYQLDGLKWLNFLDEYQFGGCLADDMGLGKSVQIIAFMLLQRAKRTDNTNLLVVPTTLLFNWQHEFRKFAPDLRVHVLYGTDRLKKVTDFATYEVILTTYNTLLTDVTYLRKFAFNYIFLDEAQQIKNPESQRYKAAQMLQARNRVVITGTPVENNTFDLYSQFSFACPGLFGSRQHFKELYSVPIDQFNDSRRARELQRKIEPFLLRRTKDQVATELPAKTEMVLYCPMEAEQRQIYDAYEKEFREFISVKDAEELKKNSMHVLKGLTKLRQICNSTRLLKSDEIMGTQTSAKLEVLRAQIENHAPHHKLVIFSQFVSMLELIRETIDQLNIGYVMLTGSTRNRESVITRFRTDDEVRVALISLKAGGTGLNLVEASYVYLVDPWWNPAVENQAIDRLHRIGQEKNITAIRLITPNTLEEKIMVLQQTKKDLTGQLVAENTNLLQSLNREQLLELVKLPY